MCKKQRESISREKAMTFYRKYRAVLLLLNSLSVEELDLIDQNLKAIESAEAIRIAERLPEIEKETKDICEKFGVIGTVEDLENAFRLDNIEDKHPLKYIAKFRLEQLFTHYERRLPNFSKLPPHSMIGIERFGASPERKKEFEIFLLEASLFEDMAALWNICLDFQQSLQTDDSKNKKKHLASLLRATVKAAFSLLEGYLNSMALDIQLTRTVSEEQKVILTEWDSSKGKVHPVKFRDKLLQYPKMALNIVHPPLTESNCPELAKILELENDLRHSLIRPTPQISKRISNGNRVHNYLNIQVEQVAEICDLVVVLIKKIDNAINGMFGSIDLWLINRCSDGYFPKDTFS